MIILLRKQHPAFLVISRGVKRKADMPLGSPLEPGQILEKNEDSKVKLKIRVRNGNSTCTMCRVFGITAVASAGFP